MIHVVLVSSSIIVSNNVFNYDSKGDMEEEQNEVAVRLRYLLNHNYRNIRRSHLDGWA